eukprot:jgi/Tetstr1/427362/TSEL_017526.t1
MRGKAEELREEVDASLSKLLSAKPIRRYTHALHHHAWALLKHCMQHKAGYWLRNCLPSEVEAFAEAVDATILAAVERVLGVSFDPSTYGTDTNPVVTDFLAELLNDPDPMAAEVATLSEDAVARARSRLHLPTRLKGAGIRRMATVRDAAFVGCMNAILPRSLTRNSGTNSTPTPGFFDPQLGSVLGRGSFNANSSARQYDHFLNDAHGSDSYAAEMREAWGRLQAATAGHLGDADARQMEREVEAASALDAAPGMWTVAIPTARTAMTPHELREVAAGYFFLPSPCLAPVVGCQIILLSTEHNPVIVDLYGDALMNLPAHGDGHWRVQHDAIADAFRDHCVHDLGIAVRRQVDDLFQQAVPLGNTVPRDELKDLVPDAELSLPAFNVLTGSYDPRSLKSTLLEFKTMRYGATAGDRFERSLLGDIQRGLAPRDAGWHNTEPGQKGPLRDIMDMSEYTGMVLGTVGEVSKGVHRTSDSAGDDDGNCPGLGATVPTNLAFVPDLNSRPGINFVARMPNVTAQQFGDSVFLAALHSDVKDIFFQFVNAFSPLITASGFRASCAASVSCLEVLDNPVADGQVSLAMHLVMPWGVPLSVANELAFWIRTAPITDIPLPSSTDGPAFSEVYGLMSITSTSVQE